MENSLKRNYYEESEDSYETIDVQRKRKRNVLTLEQKLEVICKHNYQKIDKNVHLYQ